MECCLECDLDMAAAILEDENTRPFFIEHSSRNGNESNTQYNEDLDASAETSANEECCLCLESMHPSDLVVPILCPQSGCKFNYCTQCVWNLLLTSSQPYQEASDGSNQLKIPLQCPQCRTKYPHRQIVQDVLLLRQACRLQKYFIQSTSTNTPLESTLKASELATKQAFLEQVTWEALKESWLRVDKYLKEHGKVELLNNGGTSIPKLPAQWKDILMHQPTLPRNNKSLLGHSDHSNPAAIGMGQAQYTLVDPTLFRGMEEGMTLDEQQFLSELLVSGSVPNLTQAAQILYGMLQVLQKGGTRYKDKSIAASFSNLSDTNPNSKYTRKKKHFRLLTTGTHLLYPDMDLALLKTRFPLPSSMPRWIVLPTYNPQRRGAAPWKVQPHKWGLELLSVKGAAGQQGLRRGDVITHINEEPIETTSVDDFHAHVKTLYELHSTMSLVVNAHPEAAQALQQRSFEMIHFLTQREAHNNSLRRSESNHSNGNNANNNNNNPPPVNSNSGGQSTMSTTTHSSVSTNSDDGELYVIRNTRSGM